MFLFVGSWGIGKLTVWIGEIFDVKNLEGFVGIGMNGPDEPSRRDYL